MGLHDQIAAAVGHYRTSGSGVGEWIETPVVAVIQLDEGVFRRHRLKIKLEPSGYWRQWVPIGVAVPESEVEVVIKTMRRGDPFLGPEFVCA